LIKNTSIGLSIPSLIKINLISRFYALFIPTAMGREAVRWYKVTKNQSGRLLFLASTIFERSLFILVLILFGTIPLFFYSLNAEIVSLRIKILPILILSLIIICSCIVYFIVPNFRYFFNFIIIRISQKRFKNIEFNAFKDNFALREQSYCLYFHVFILGIIWQVVFIIRLFALFKAAALPLTFIDVTWMGSLVLLLQVLPISFAGIGMREGAYAYLFTLFNLPPEKGVLIGILFFSQMLILAGIGGLLEWMDE
jgi:uncharacterized membrane protein YbhN (UPF0104 family)